MFLTFATFGCKITNFFRHVQEKKLYFAFLRKKIWSCRKKAVPLHAFSAQLGEKATCHASGDCIRSDRIVVYA